LLPNLKVTVWLYLYMGPLLKISVALYNEDFDTQLCATSKLKDFLRFPFKEPILSNFSSLKM
jgi:hypothetical protein